MALSCRLGLERQGFIVDRLLTAIGIFPRTATNSCPETAIFVTERDHCFRPRPRRSRRSARSWWARPRHRWDVLRLIKQSIDLRARLLTLPATHVDLSARRSTGNFRRSPSRPRS